MKVFCDERFICESYQRTIGVDLKVKFFQLNEDSERMKLLIWDQGYDREKFGRSTSSYYQGADYIIIVFDITNIESFENIQFWLKEIKLYNQDMSMNHIVIVGNKLDLKIHRIISFRDAKQYSESNCIRYTEASIKQPITVNKIFNILFSDLKSKNNLSEIQRIDYKMENNKKLILLNPKTLINGNDQILNEKESLNCLLALMFTISTNILLKFDDNNKILTISHVMLGFCGYLYCNNHNCNGNRIDILYKNIERIEFRHNYVHKLNLAHYYPIIITKQGNIYKIGRSDNINNIEVDMLRLHKFIFDKENNNYEPPNLDQLGVIVNDDVTLCKECKMKQR